MLSQHFSRKLHGGGEGEGEGRGREREEEEYVNKAVMGKRRKTEAKVDEPPEAQLDREGKMLMTKKTVIIDGSILMIYEYN